MEIPAKSNSTGGYSCHHIVQLSVRSRIKMRAILRRIATSFTTPFYGRNSGYNLHYPIEFTCSVVIVDLPPQEYERKVDPMSIAPHELRNEQYQFEDKLNETASDSWTLDDTLRIDSSAFLLLFRRVAINAHSGLLDPWCEFEGSNRG